MSSLKSFVMQAVEAGRHLPPEGYCQEPGLEQFLRDASLSGDATEGEIAFLRTLRFGERRPTPLYYYREVQNLRDPLHFTE